MAPLTQHYRGFIIRVACDVDQKLGNSLNPNAMFCLLGYYPSQPGNGWRLKKCSQGHLNLKGFSQSRDEFRSQDRMSPDLKEVLMNTNFIQAENIRPDRDKDLFESGARRLKDIFSLS